MEAANDDGMGLARQAIKHAVCSGRLSVGVARYPEAAKGLLKAYRFHHEAAGRLLEEMLAGVAETRPGHTSLG